MGWVSPFLSSIFLPREQNKNIKSLEMSWYITCGRRLQMRTDQARHKRTHQAVLTWSFLIYEEELDHALWIIICIALYADYMPSLRSLKIGKEGNINSSLPFSIRSLLFSGLMKACHCQVPGYTWCHSGAARTEISVHSGPRGSTDLQTLEHRGRSMPCLLRLFILSVDSMWNTNDYDIENLDWLLTDTCDNTW